ncbi:MAG: TatD family hydrolase [Spirochaetaceae bacterium]|nr:TatD family hydrolase [Spirochaetaceae bacterium]
MYVDAHLHLYDIAECLQFERTALEQAFCFDSFSFCTSSCSKSEFEYSAEFCSEKNLNAFFSFGVHPQNPTTQELSTLEHLLQTKRLDAIGEIGFDLYDEYFASLLHEQKEVWNIQLELAMQYDVPIIVHLRKSNHLLFTYLKQLKKIKAVIFHSWPSGSVEALSLLKKGVNAYFSVGKALLRGKKSVYDLVRTIEVSRLLTETDAPYMTLLDEPFSIPSDIKKVVAELCRVKQGENRDSKITEDAMSAKIEKNFFSIFNRKDYS